MKQMKSVFAILGILLMAACSSDQPIQPTGPVSNVTNETVISESNPICRSVSSTFFGGRETNTVTSINAISIGSNGHIYVAGTTDSHRLPGTRNNYQSNINPKSSGSAFVAEFSGDLRTLIAATYFGGPGESEVRALAVGKGGQIYVAGQMDLGKTFVAELTQDLTKERNFILARAEPISAMTIAPDGNVYVTGGGVEGYAYVVELTPDLNLLRKNVSLGGSGEKNWANAIAIGSGGKVYMAGDTSSTDLPKSLGGAQPTFSGNSDGFVVELSVDLQRVIQATYFGGNNSTATSALAVGKQGQVYVTGYTSSADLPGTNGAAQSRLASSDDAYITELSSDLKSIVRTTYIGGARDDSAWAMAVSNDDQVYVAGKTNSSEFPGTSGGVQGEMTRGFTFIHLKHGFISKVSSDLTRVIQSSYYIGTDYNGHSLDEIRGIALGSNGYLYLTGNTQSTSLPCGQLGALGTPGDKVYGGFVARYPDALTKDNTP